MIISIEPQAPFGEAVKRAPKQGIEHSDEDRHFRDAELDFGIIAVCGRLGNVVAEEKMAKGRAGDREDRDNSTRISSADPRTPSGPAAIMRGTKGPEI
jgi:hypothetical protein